MRLVLGFIDSLYGVWLHFQRVSSFAPWFITHKETARVER